ncbi:GIY-YIG nuclease family protein [Engelhardtia mirabilis]|uniref:GIY-YIG domain-containing protein n=1 Tax=Engelhardtia mirabilis TaxID=2528011 RepID=A0A518BIE6_9BACT|nr:hypothetical protein Pla133_18240 [Planctomycetes bacterium Pla133]QDV01074.1 hypothetical protein Pla86_18230 [Planctomycetes bacterium Pla86]
MNLSLDWHKPIAVKRVTARTLEYAIDIDLVPREPGVYIFARRWGARYEALYVGKARRLRGRIQSHLNNRSLLNHLADARTGKRVLLLGLLQSRPGQQLDRCLTVAERALMRHFLSEGHDLVNIQGTKIRRHVVESTGHAPKRFLPQEVQLEVGRGE